MILKILCEMTKKYKMYQTSSSSITIRYLSSSISQGCSLHFVKSSRGAGVEIVERDNIL
jgi:hypothetical protein